MTGERSKRHVTSHPVLLLLEALRAKTQDQTERMIFYIDILVSHPSMRTSGKSSPK